MALLKTTTLSQNPAQAEQEFKQELTKELVLLVVLGSGSDAATLAEMADGLAGSTRWIIWAPNPEALQTAIAGLPRKAGVEAPNLSTPDRGFVISFDKEIADVIRRDESEPHKARVFKAFIKGN